MIRPSRMAPRYERLLRQTTRRAPAVAGGAAVVVIAAVVASSWLGREFLPQHPCCPRSP